MAISSENTNDGFSDINVTPLTDVLLVLLIIFLITGGSITAPSHAIELPKVITREKAENISIVIDVTRKGETFVGNKKCETKELYAYLKKLAAEKKTNRVIINGDSKCDYVHVVTAMFHARKAGLTDIALATEEKPKSGKLAAKKVSVESGKAEAKKK
ncbi:biopolymer transporter ExbD [bacterium]|nr:biopolymer transporter ExbD [bacterium]